MSTRKSSKRPRGKVAKKAGGARAPRMPLVEFARAWNACASPEDVDRKFPNPQTARARANNLRRRGVDLKAFDRRGGGRRIDVAAVNAALKG